MSPPIKLGNILFLALSVCPSCFRVRSISFEPLLGLTNNSAHLSSTMRRCAVRVLTRSVEGQGHSLRINIV